MICFILGMITGIFFGFFMCSLMAMSKIPQETTFDVDIPETHIDETT